LNEKMLQIKELLSLKYQDIKEEMGLFSGKIS
jgi:hypothetical protein